MPVVYLLRHGQASFGSADYDVLSTRGEHQAAIVGGELRRRGVDPDKVVCGTLNRQRETARLAMVAGSMGAELEVDPRWNEFDHEALVKAHLDMARPSSTLGQWTNSGEFQLLLDAALKDWITGLLPGWSHFATGVIEVLQETVEGLPRGGDAVVVTSSGVIATICASLLSVPDSQGRRPSGPHPDVLVPLNRVSVNAAITTLISGASGINLVTYNDHAHLLGTSVNDAKRELVTYR